MAHLGIWAQNGENHKNRDFSQISTFINFFSLHSIRNLFLESLGVVLKNFDFFDTKNPKTEKIHYRFVGGGPKVAHMAIEAKNGENQKNRESSQISAFINFLKVYYIRNIFFGKFWVCFENF